MGGVFGGVLLNWIFRAGLLNSSRSLVIVLPARQSRGKPWPIQGLASQHAIFGTLRCQSLYDGPTCFPTTIRRLMVLHKALLLISTAEFQCAAPTALIS